jgi:hypothetical protein
MSRSIRTEPARAGRRSRRTLPAGWRILPGMGAAATCIDPTIEQTRELTYALFGASLLGRNVGFHRYPAAALRAWTDHALRRGDPGLARILEQLDADTFSEVWSSLVRRCDQHGAPDTIEWLQRRLGGV